MEIEEPLLDICRIMKSEAELRKESGRINELFISNPQGVRFLDVQH